jgi:hypothetical protein
MLTILYVLGWVIIWEVITQVAYNRGYNAAIDEMQKAKIKEE